MDTKVINGITFTAQLDVDAAGKATVTYTMIRSSRRDIPIAVHSYTDINLGPKQFINGVIPAGADHRDPRGAPHRVRSARHQGRLHHAG